MRGYRLFAHGAVKTFIVPKDLIARSSPMNSIGVKLKSFFKTDLHPIQSPKVFSKTQDLETAGGNIYLAHEDPHQLKRDVDFLRDLEYVLEQLSDLEDISYRVMMGEYIIYYRKKIVGGIYDDRFLVKSVEVAMSMMPDAKMEMPYEGAKEMILVDDIENREFLKELFEAMYDELPSPRKRK